MNFKQYFPTFRNRYRFVQRTLQSTQRRFERGLNLGTGEGDYDQMLASFCDTLIGCDVNEADLQHAAQLNRNVPNLHYELNNALALSYPNAYFDLLVSSEVIEHVGQPAQMLREISRVLRPDGLVVLTFPSREFPFTYDPINRIWQWMRTTSSREYLISQGAYAFGHEYLIGAADFRQWAEAAGLEIVHFRGLSHHLVGLLEMYWTGLAQSIFKKNARNVSNDKTVGLTVRPASVKVPPGVFVTDFICTLDSALFGWSVRSAGKGVILRKRK